MDLDIKDRLLWKFRNLIRQQPGEAALGAAAEPIIVAGLFSVASGIGQSARMCADALEVGGFEVTRLDLSAGFGQGDLEDKPGVPDRAPKTGGTLILHLNGPETERGLFLARVLRGSRRKLIGAWVWELPCPPPGWGPASEMLDEIWVPSAFVKKAITPICRCPVRVVPYVLGDLSCMPLALPSDTVSVLVMGDGLSSFSRKNVVGSIKAFKLARLPERVRLIVKTRNLMACPELGEEILSHAGDDPRINLTDEVLSRRAHLELLQGCDIFMSLHRAEGFGLVIAEAMALGKAVIATNWSANAEFMDERSSVPVPSRQVPINEPAGVYGGITGAVWAEPDIRYAAEALSQLASDPARRARMGEAAKARVSNFTSGKVYAEALGLVSGAAR
jgi:glycosyltransferase involved in cell wall biosynthesis